MSDTPTHPLPKTAVHVDRHIRGAVQQCLDFGQIVVIVPCHVWIKQLKTNFAYVCQFYRRKKKVEQFMFQAPPNHPQLVHRLLPSYVRSDAQWGWGRSCLVLLQSLQRARLLLAIHITTLKVGLRSERYGEGERGAERAKSLPFQKEVRLTQQHNRVRFKERIVFYLGKMAPLKLLSMIQGF